MEQIDVKILGRDYKLAVNPDEKSKLLDAVKMVDDKMHAIRDAGKISGVDRIAVMTALQLAHELLSSAGSPAGAPNGELLKRIRKMTDDLDSELKRQENLF
jgi:cell division protein ZapA